MNRRKFLVTSSATACACSLGLALGAKSSWAAGKASDKKLRIRVIYALHAPVQSRPDWPNVGFDFRPVMQKWTKQFSATFPAIEFLTTMSNGKEQTRAIIGKGEAEKIDGYIVCQMNCKNKVIETVAKTGKPTLYVDFLYGGTGRFLTQVAKLTDRKVKNVGFISSSDFDDVLRAVGCFQTCTDPNGFADAVTAVRVACTPKAGDLTFKPDDVKTISPEAWKKQLGKSKILAFKSNKTVKGQDRDYAGIPLVYLPFSELNDAWKTADRDQAKEVAARWAKGAEKIENVTQAELENSAAMYLGQKALLKKYAADAITINCLGGFYGGHIHAYPCLGFHQLCNEGLIGGCECDVDSAATMVALKNLTGGRTGFISDPVLDVAKREIIYAHCVASNRAFGPDGPANPYQILTHSEDRKGAAVRSFYPEGYMATTIKMEPRGKTIGLHQVKTTGNSTDDRACRTKLKGEVIGDFEKLYTYWHRYKWHRVTVYGDLKDQVYGMADALGWKVVEEA
jgi:hypothetical protein